jgi:hypothetical protein
MGTSSIREDAASVPAARARSVGTSAALDMRMASLRTRAGAMSAAAALSLLLLPRSAHAAEPLAPANESAPSAVVQSPSGDLFPTPGRLSLSAASGLPFLGIGEVGVGLTRGVAIGAIGGVTPSVLTAGIRPRFLVRASERIAFLLVVPMLYYPKASAPGPGNIGSTTWVLARPELMLDGTVSERLHVAGGMGIIAAASTVALGNKLQGKEFALPAYEGSGDTKHGFAGGIWNTVCSRASYAVRPDTHLFAEGSLVLSGISLADNVGGPPVVITAGVQHTF